LAGDPLTPGYAATKDAPRIDPEDSPGLTKIPSLPLSWKDALPLLKATQGRGFKGDAGWKGGLHQVDYYSGPTEGDVILTNHVDNKITPIWNVIGRIDGTEEPEHAVIIGNHRDAWVYGAVDPSSGSATLVRKGVGRIG
jgi:N-acetylated-alpha-linked acidic dipeptidase